MKKINRIVHVVLDNIILIVSFYYNLPIRKVIYTGFKNKLLVREKEEINWKALMGKIIYYIGLQLL